MPFLGRKILAALPACLTLSCEAPSRSQPEIFQEGQAHLRGGSLGLSTREIALTLDDGLGPWSVGLARYLERRGVSATFFVNAANGQFGIRSELGRERLTEICSMNFHAVGSHSDEHSTVDRSWTQLDEVHGILQELCPQELVFFRAPGGNWDPADARRLNRHRDMSGRGLAGQYIGPVFWDRDGEDWSSSCRANPSRCRDDHFRMVTASTAPAVLLMHEIYASSIEILVGSHWQELLENTDAVDPEDGLIARLQKKGYTFVALGHNRSRIAELLGPDLPPPTPEPNPPNCLVKSSDGFANVRETPGGSVLTTTHSGTHIYGGPLLGGNWRQVRIRTEDAIWGYPPQKAFIHASLLQCWQ